MSVQLHVAERTHATESESRQQTLRSICYNTSIIATGYPIIDPTTRPIRAVALSVNQRALARSSKTQ